MSRRLPVQLVAVVGGSGAGKGWLVERLCQHLGYDACRLHLDDFYRDRSHLPLARRAQLNFDIPAAIDWEWAERVLLDCRAGQSTTLPCYDFATFSRTPLERTWSPRPIVFVDGLWLLRPPAVRRLFDLKIYLDTPTELRCTRRLARDVAERGYSREMVDRQLRHAVLPMHERYVEPQRKHADLVLRQPFEEASLLELSERLWGLLARASLRERWQHETFRADLVALLSRHEYCT
jgi:uridine kinase